MQPLPLMVDIDMGEMNMLDTAMVDTGMVDTDIVDTEVNMLQGWPFVRALIYTQLKNVTQPPVVTNMRYVKLLKVPVCDTQMEKIWLVGMTRPAQQQTPLCWLRVVTFCHTQ